MALQASIAARNAALDAIEATIGASPTLEIRSGAAPATCGAADAGTLLASLPLPSDWMANASAGAKGLAGTSTDTGADAAGIAGHYRVKQGATCHLQGSVSATGGGGDMTLDNTSIATGQPVTVTAFVISLGGA